MTAHDEVVEQVLSGVRDGADRFLERRLVVRRRGPETRDLPDVLQRGSLHVLVGHRLGERRAQRLDTSAHRINPSLHDCCPGLLVILHVS